jgi:hypothetical protein
MRRATDGMGSAACASAVAEAADVVVCGDTFEPTRGVLAVLASNSWQRGQRTVDSDSGGV